MGVSSLRIESLTRATNQSGNIATTLSDFTASVNAARGSPGALSATLGDATASINAAKGSAGAVSATLDSVTVDTNAAFGHGGPLSATLEYVTVASGGVLGHAIALDVTLDSVAVDLTGTVVSNTGVTGTLDVTLDGISFQSQEDKAPEKVGGDDAFHPGWDKEAWKKKHQQEEALTETIQATYNRILGIEPNPILIEQIKEEIKEAPLEAQKAATFDYLSVAEWLSIQENVVAQIIEKRLQDEADDEEALLLLL